MTYRKSDGSCEGGDQHPAAAAEVGCRLDAIISLYPTKKAAADMAGVSPDQLARYVKGQSAAPFEVLARVAVAKGVSLDWLATGKGLMRTDAPPQTAAPVADPLDLALMGVVIATVAEWLADKKIRVDADKLQRLCIAVYRVVQRQRRRYPSGEASDWRRMVVDAAEDVAPELV